MHAGAYKCQGSSPIIAVLKQHFEGWINKTVERRNLTQRKQQIGESFDDFLRPSCELAKMYNLCNNKCLQKALRDQIIEGLHDREAIQANVNILSHSGADICMAELDFVHILDEHMDNLADSDIVPRAVNGSFMHPVVKILDTQSGANKCPAHLYVTRE